MNIDVICTIDNAQPGVLKLPFGRYPSNDGSTVQVINKRTCSDMARMLAGGETLWEWAKSVLKNGFSSLWGKAAPVVIGHPNNPAAPTYGKITKIEVLDNEAYFHTDWKPEGAALVTGDSPKFRKWSPRFKARTEGGLSFPFAIVHGGLTNKPNIPVPDIAEIDNEAGAEPGAVYTIQDLDNSDTLLSGPIGELDNDYCAVPMNSMVSLRQKLYLPDDATLEQIDAALAVREAQVNKDKTDLDALRNQLATEQDTSMKLVDQNNELKTQLTAADEGRKTLAKGMVNTCLKALQLTGRVLPADFQSEIARLSELDNERMVKELDLIAARKPVMKTGSLMGDTAKGARLATIDNEVNKGARDLKVKTAQVDERKRSYIAGGMEPVAAYNKAFKEILG